MASYREGTDFNNVIPELKDWNNGNGIDVDSWVQCVANHKILVGCARTLWPDFVELDDGCIVIASREPNWRGYLEKVHGDRKTAEATINHIHILHLFSALPTRELVLYVGRLLKGIWQVKLQHDFPDRRITVSFPEEDDLELDEYELTFFQEQ
jgi:hypothetical protein